MGIKSVAIYSDADAQAVREFCVYVMLVFQATIDTYTFYT